jgi:flagellar basal body-associated protein FliL
MFESADEKKSKNWIIIWVVTGILAAAMVVFAILS